MSLDDPQVYKALDPADMGGLMEGMPVQCRAAWQQGIAFSLSARFEQAERVFVLGMGGSAIGADLAAGLQAAEGGRPVLVSRELRLPPGVDARTLVIAASHSGNTEETLTAFREALERKAMAVGLTTGGALARLCAQEGVPLFQYQWPGPPRTAIGYGLFPLLAWLQRLGLGSDRTKAVESAIGEMELLSWELRVQTPEARNRAKQLARHIGQRAVVIYGAEYLAAVAHRWKSQINENAKSWAFYDALPEAGHNSIEGLRLPALARDAMYAIVLRAASYHPRIARRCDLFTEALARVGVVHEVVEAPGSTPLAQVMTSVLLGDYTSYYLGILRGVDPAATPALDLLKEQMAQG